MNVIVKPSKLKGTVMVPPSKSLSHRAIIAACLAKGKSIISNVLYSEDIIATLDAMEACGAKIKRLQNSLEIQGSQITRVRNEIDAHESGSTIRFMIPIALVNPKPVRFIGKNHLVKRPLDVYFNIFNEQGIKFKKGDDYLPLETTGGLKPGVFSIPGNISSQFVTGLLFALPLLDGDSKIVITSKLESKGYIDLTLDVLSLFGIEVLVEDENHYSIKGNQKYKSRNYTIEGDYSQSAFWLVADMIGHEVILQGMNLDSKQGDKKILQDIKDFGAKLNISSNALYCTVENKKPSTIDFSQSPDLGPALSVLASLTNGESNFVEASRLRIKECDRITCMKEELNKIGAKVSEEADTMSFVGVGQFEGGCDVDSHNDHRIAMAMAVAATVCNKEIRILNAGCVKKSYPHFFEDMKLLGGEIIYEE